jgi:hypothetical protein
MAGGTDAAVQLLRRLWYCGRIPGGAKFDNFINTKRGLLQAPAVRQAVLDGLTRSGTLKVAPVSSDRDVDLSHIFVLLDYALNGDGRDASLLKLVVSSDTSCQAMLSWLGDLASVWTGLQSQRQRWIRAHPGQVPARGTPDQPDTEAWWLEKAFSDRSPTSDLLGDFDGVVLAAELVKDPSQPVAGLFRGYYTSLSAPAPGDLNVANRLSLFLDRCDPQLPTATFGGQVSITADTSAALRRMVDVSSRILLGAAREKNHDWWGVVKVPGEVDSDWGQWAVGQISDRFARFLEALAADGPTTGIWPSSQPTSVNLGYAATLRGRAADVLVSGDPNTAEVVDTLEAMAQYYMTSDDPWGPPPAPESGLHPVWLGDFTGKAARSAQLASGKPGVALGDALPWGEIWPAAWASAHRDLIKLDAATTGDFGVFRIEAVDPAGHTLTLDRDPGLGQSVSAWTIMRRPRLVLVDAFGHRPHLSGTVASLQAGAATVTAVRVDTDAGTAAALAGVNLGIDTILLDDDEAVPRLPYRILSIDVTDPTHPLIGLDRPPTLSLPTRWQIPAGIGGGESAIAASNPPNPGAGCDHYDGQMYLIYGGTVRAVFPWTSYTSFRPPAGFGDGVTSLRGNRRYAARAFYSDNNYKNHSLAIVTMFNRAISIGVNNWDSVPGRNYYAGVATLPNAADTTAPLADKPESLIRIHYGDNVPPNGKFNSTESAACLVSPKFFDMRASLIQIYQDELHDLGVTQPDPDLQTVANALTLDAAKAAYNAVPSAKWTDIVHAELFVIHSDERSSQPVAILTPWVDR